MKSLRSLFACSLLFALLAFVSTPAFAQAADQEVGTPGGSAHPSLKALDTKNGFRQFRFGEDVSQYPALKAKSNKEMGGMRYYTHTSENLKVGGADLQSIAYAFYKDKLAAIFIQTEDVTNTLALRDVLCSQYTSGYRSNPYIEHYFWFGKRVTMSYEQHPTTGAGMVMLLCNELRKRQKNADALAAKHARADL